MSKIIAGCNTDMLDSIAINISDIVEKLQKYYAKLEDEFNAIEDYCDFEDKNLLKRELKIIKKNYKIMENNINKTFEDIIQVKANYKAIDQNVGSDFNYSNNKF